MVDMSPWIPIIGTAVGGVLTVIGGFLAERMTTGREREGRRVEAEERRKRQKAEFQVKTLLEVQDAAWEILNAGRHAAGRALQKTDPETRRRAVMSVDVLDAWEKAVAQQIRLTARLDDPQVRDLLTRLRVQANDAMRLASSTVPEPSAETCKAANETLLTTFEIVNGRIGELLRELT